MSSDTEGVDFDIYQGDTGPILRPRPSVLDDAEVIGASWHCYLAVNDEDGNEVIAKFEVTDKTADNLRWIAALTPDNTAGIDPNARYEMVLEVSDATTIPPFKKEKHYVIQILEQGIL